MATISVEDVVEAIKILKDYKGSSRQALVKYFKSEKGIAEPGAALKKALENGVSSGVLLQTKSSFKVKGVVFEEPAETKVVIETTRVGEASSPPVQAGDSVTVAYEGRLLDGSVFDSATSFGFEVGAGEVIKGWDVGVEGMRKGEKRKLTIPPKMGYGKRGSPPEIPGDATLVFDITLLGIKR